MRVAVLMLGTFAALTAATGSAHAQGRSMGYGLKPIPGDTGPKEPEGVAFTQNLEFDVRKVGGWKSTLLSGEGLVCEFRGSGTLYLQTRSTQAFLSWLIPRIPTGTGGGGGTGRGGGILGNILRGN